MLPQNGSLSNLTPAHRWPITNKADGWRWLPGPPLDCGIPLTDWAEAFHVKDRQVATQHLNQAETMTLPELIRFQALFFGSWNNEAGDLVADTLLTLAQRIDDVRATTVAEFRDRESILDRDSNGLLSTTPDALLHCGSDPQWCQCRLCVLDRTARFAND